MLPNSPQINFNVTKENRAVFWKRLNPRLYTSACVEPPEFWGSAREDTPWNKKVIWGFNEDGSPVTTFYDTGVVELPEYNADIADMGLIKSYSSELKEWFSCNNLHKLNRKFRFSGQVQAWKSDFGGKTMHRFLRPRLELWYFVDQIDPIVLDYDTGELTVPELGVDMVTLTETSLGYIKNGGREMHWKGCRGSRTMVEASKVKRFLHDSFAMSYAEMIQQDRITTERDGMVDTNLPIIAVHGCDLSFQDKGDNWYIATHLPEPRDLLRNVQSRKQLPSIRMNGIKASFKAGMEFEGIADIISKETSVHRSHNRLFKRDDFIAYQELTTNKSNVIARMQELISNYQKEFGKWKRTFDKSLWEDETNKFLATNVALTYTWGD